MERYLIALDMDGTLLNSEGEISKKTSDYLKELEKKDILLSFLLVALFVRLKDIMIN